MNEEYCVVKICFDNTNDVRRCVSYLTNEHLFAYAHVSRIATYRLILDGEEEAEEEAPEKNEVESLIEGYIKEMEDFGTAEDGENAAKEEGEEESGMLIEEYDKKFGGYSADTNALGFRSKDGKDDMLLEIYTSIRLANEIKLIAAGEFPSCMSSYLTMPVLEISDELKRSIHELHVYHGWESGDGDKDEKKEEAAAH